MLFAYYVFLAIVMDLDRILDWSVTLKSHTQKNKKMDNETKEKMEIETKTKRKLSTDKDSHGLTNL